MIKIVGKKIISGDSDLALENSTFSCCMNPYFMKKVLAEDPLNK